MVAVARGGRAPKPTALRLLDGGHPERINQHEPAPSPGSPLPPEEMSGAARRVWDYTLAELDVMGVASPADRDSLACYCEAVVNHRKSSALLAKSDVLVRGVLGNPVRNPALAVQRDSAELIRKFAQEFGLTPSARSRIEVRAGAVEVNPFAGPELGTA